MTTNDGRNKYVTVIYPLLIKDSRRYKRYLLIIYIYVCYDTNAIYFPLFIVLIFYKLVKKVYQFIIIIVIVS